MTRLSDFTTGTMNQHPAPPRLVALMAYAATTLPQDALSDLGTNADPSGPTLPVHIVTASLRRGFGHREEHGLMMGGWALLVDAAFELQPGSKRRDWTVSFGKVLTAEGPFAAWMWAVGEAGRAKEAA